MPEADLDRLNPNATPDVNQEYDPTNQSMEYGAVNNISVQDENLPPGYGHNSSGLIHDTEITRKVERDKLNQIHKASNNLRANLSKQQGRCMVCTLMPPCKHNAGGGGTDRSYLDSHIGS